MPLNEDWPYGPAGQVTPGPKAGSALTVVPPPGVFSSSAGNPDPRNNGSTGRVASQTAGGVSSGVGRGFGYPSPTVTTATPVPGEEQPIVENPIVKPDEKKPDEDLLNPATGNLVNPMWLTVMNTGSPEDANPGDPPTAAQMARHPEWGQTWQTNRKLYLQSMSRYTTYIEDQIARSSGSRQETLNNLGIYPVHERGLASWNKYSQELIDQIRAGYVQKHFDNQALLGMIGRYPAGQVPAQYPYVPPAGAKAASVPPPAAPAIDTSSFSIPGVTVPVGRPLDTQGKVAATSTTPVTQGAATAKGQVAALGPTVWSRVPTGTELSMVPPGTTAETPVGTFSNVKGQPTVTLNAAGYQAYQSAIAKLSQQFGFNPLGDVAGAPAVPLEVGKHNFNPFTGQWITPQKRRTA